MRFILIDKILELEPGKNIKAVKCFSADEEFFQDHFPGFPVVPGVLQTEMMAQAAGKCLDAEKRQRGKAMLVEIKKARFRDWMKPEQTANILAEILANRDQYATARCSIEINEKKICSAELFFSFLPLDQFSPDFKDEIRTRPPRQPSDMRSGRAERLAMAGRLHRFNRFFNIIY
jgi:3-hydroxyacyl-[acyl-carrier-protein] dehydratase